METEIHTNAYQKFCINLGRAVDFYMYRTTLKTIKEISQSTTDKVQSILSFGSTEIVQSVKKPDEVYVIDLLINTFELYKQYFSDHDLNSIKNKLLALREIYEKYQNINNEIRSVVNEISQKILRKSINDQSKNKQIEIISKLQQFLPEKSIEGMNFSDIAKITKIILKKVVEEGIIRPIDNKEPIMTELLRELCLVYLQSIVEAYLQDFILELDEKHILKIPIKRSEIKDNLWRDNKEILDQSGYNFYQVEKFEEITKKRNRLLHKSNEAVSPTFLEEKFNYIKELVQNFEGQIYRKM